MKNKIKKWLWNYANKKDYYPEDDFEELLDTYEERKWMIRRKLFINDDSKLNDLASSLQMLHTQREIEKSNKSLKSATWILAAATAVFAISTIIGARSTELFLIQSSLGFLQVFGIFIIGVVSLVILDFIAKFIIRRWLKGKNLN